MGRTLHYTLTFPAPLQPTELALLERICDNSRKVRPMGYDPKEFDWTCENFGIDPYDHYPHWENLKKLNPDKPQEAFTRAFTALKKIGHARGAALEQMAKEGLLTWVNTGGPAATSMRGFTKVQGNELNAMWVVYTLLTISRAFPKALITCHDEGRYLRCPIRMRAGLAQMNIEQFEQDMAGQAARFVGAILKRDDSFGEHPAAGLPKEVREDLFPTIYKAEEVLYWIRSSCESAKDVIGLMAAHLANTPSRFGGTIPPHLIDLGSVWIGIENFHRPVISAHFAKSRKAEFSEIMSGFYGEHWKLEPDKDARAESAKMLKFVCKITGAKTSELRVGVSI